MTSRDTKRLWFSIRQKLRRCDMSFKEHKEKVVAQEGQYHSAFTGCLVAPDGTERHFINGAYGRESDLPSIIYPDGTMVWCIENPKRGGFGQSSAVVHLDGDEPAIIRANGDLLYYRFGKLHRVGGPAVILSDGTNKWFNEGECFGYQIRGGRVVMKESKIAKIEAAEQLPSP